MYIAWKKCPMFWTALSLKANRMTAQIAQISTVMIITLIDFITIMFKGLKGERIVLPP
jgi:hypothetical protein